MSTSVLSHVWILNELLNRAVCSMREDSLIPEPDEIWQVPSRLGFLKPATTHFEWRYHNKRILLRTVNHVVVSVVSDGNRLKESPLSFFYYTGFVNLNISGCEATGKKAQRTWQWFVGKLPSYGVHPSVEPIVVNSPEDLQGSVRYHLYQAHNWELTA